MSALSALCVLGDMPGCSPSKTNYQNVPQAHRFTANEFPPYFYMYCRNHGLTVPVGMTKQEAENTPGVAKFGDFLKAQEAANSLQGSFPDELTH